MSGMTVVTSCTAPLTYKLAPPSHPVTAVAGLRRRCDAPRAAGCGGSIAAGYGALQGLGDQRSLERCTSCDVVGCSHFSWSTLQQHAHTLPILHARAAGMRAVNVRAQALHPAVLHRIAAAP